MSASTPEDLAVAFRSLARRQREAIGDADASAFGHLTAELQRHVAGAAAVVGSTADADAVAAAIRSRRDWEDADLAAVQQEALDAAAVLRRLAAEAEAQRVERDDRG